MTPAETEAMFEAEEHHWWYVGMREIVRALLAAEGLPEDARSTTLDAGCGTGFNLTGFGPRAIGVDASERALELCRARGLDNTRLASVEALPFEVETFDRVFSLDVLSDAGVRDDALAVRELARVLRPGGYLVVRVPALEALRRAHDRAVETRRRYTRAGLCRLLEQSGLHVLRCTYCNTLLLPLVAARAVSDRVQRGPARSDLGASPRIVGRALATCLRLEASLLARWDFPLGTSLVAIAVKRSDSALA